MRLAAGAMAAGLVLAASLAAMALAASTPTVSSLSSSKTQTDDRRQLAGPHALLAEPRDHPSPAVQDQRMLQILATAHGQLQPRHAQGRSWRARPPRDRASQRDLPGHAPRPAALSLLRRPRQGAGQRAGDQELRRHLARGGRLLDQQPASGGGAQGDPRHRRYTNVDSCPSHGGVRFPLSWPRDWPAARSKHRPAPRPGVSWWAGSRRSARSLSLGLPWWPVRSPAPRREEAHRRQLDSSAQRLVVREAVMSEQGAGGSRAPTP